VPIAVRKISSQGQVNVPKEVCKLLGVKPGEKIEYALNESGEIVIKKSNPLSTADNEYKEAVIGGGMSWASAAQSLSIESKPSRGLYDKI
jgi:AbrB family looped-hinge helix DNA binding protein